MAQPSQQIRGGRSVLEHALAAGQFSNDWRPNTSNYENVQFPYKNIIGAVKIGGKSSANNHFYAFSGNQSRRNDEPVLALPREVSPLRHVQNQ